MRKAKTKFKDYDQFRKAEKSVLDSFSIDNELRKSIEVYFRLCYLVEQFLIYRLEIKELKIFTTYISLIHNKICSKLITDKSNIQMIISNIKANRQVYFEILYRFLEVVKLNHILLSNVQKLLNKNGIFEFIEQTVNCLFFNNISGQLVVDETVSFYKIPARFLQFINFFAIVANNNQNLCSRLFFKKDKGFHYEKILRFIIQSLFQISFKLIDQVAIVLFNIVLSFFRNSTTEGSEDRQIFFDLLISILEEIDFEKNQSFFKFLSLLIDSGITDLLDQIDDRLSIITVIQKNMFQIKSKKIQLSMLDVLHHFFNKPFTVRDQQVTSEFISNCYKQLTKRRMNLVGQKILIVLKILYKNQAKSLNDVPGLIEFIEQTNPSK